MGERKLRLIVDLDTDAAEKRLVQLEQASAKAISGGAGKSRVAEEDKILSRYLTRLEGERSSLTSLNRLYEQKISLINKLEGRKGYSQELAQAKKEAAGLLDSVRKLTESEAQQIELLTRSNKLREEARAKASSASHAGATSGGGGSSNPKSGDSGGSALASLGGVTGKLAAAGAAALAVVGSSLADLGHKAQEVARTTSDAGGPLDKLRQSEERLNQARSQAANSPAIAKLQTVVNDLEGRFLGGLARVVDGIDDIFKSSEQRFADKKQALERTANGVSLFGDEKIGRDELKRGKAEFEQDNTRDRIEMEEGFMRRRRDFEQELAQYKVEQARKVEDLEVGHSRKMQDMAQQRAELEEDKAFKISEAKYGLERKSAKRDFEKSLGDKKEDFDRKRKYAKEDFGTKQGDEKEDLALELGHDSEDYRDKVNDMALSNADGLSYIQASRDARKSKRRKQQALAIKQGRDKRQFTTEEGREQTEFQTETTRSKRDFADKEGDTAKAHALDVELHLYQQKIASINIEKEANRELEDFAKNIKRLNEDDTFSKKKFEGQKHDMDFDEGMQRDKFEVGTNRHRRGIDESMADNAYQIYKSDPASFLDKAKKDPSLVEDFNRQQGRRGDDWGFDMDKIRAQQGQAAGELETLKKQDPRYYGLPPVGMGQKGANEDIYGPAKKKQQMSPEQYRALARMPEAERKAKMKEWGINPDGTISSYASGGYIDQNKLAMLHAGEFVVNPGGSDKAQQAGLAVKALNKMGFSPGLGSSSSGGAKFRGGGLSPMLGQPGAGARFRGGGLPFEAIMAPAGGGGSTYNLDLGDMHLPAGGGGISPEMMQMIQGVRKEYETKLGDVMKQNLALQTRAARSSGQGW
jgi:hypothetical protein